jgi:hypothetical protein
VAALKIGLKMRGQQRQSLARPGMRRRKYRGDTVDRALSASRQPKTVGMVYKSLPVGLPIWRFFAAGPVLALVFLMLRKIATLFVIKKRWEAWAIIYALAVGATGRGMHYLDVYPGLLGYLLFLACTAAVFMAGAKILDGTQPKWRGKERRRLEQADRREPAAFDPGAEFKPAFFRDPAASGTASSAAQAERGSVREDEVS